MPQIHLGIWAALELPITQGALAGLISISEITVPFPIRGKKWSKVVMRVGAKEITFEFSKYIVVSWTFKSLSFCQCSNSCEGLIKASLIQVYLVQLDQHASLPLLYLFVCCWQVAHDKLNIIYYIF